MATIKQLSEADIVENGDQFPFFSEAQGDTRKVTFATLKDSVATDFVSTADLAAQTGATLVGCNGGTTVQQELDALDSGKASLAALAASTGSSLVGHIATGTGAVARTVQSKLRDFKTLQDFDGVVGDGINDDTDGVQAALTWLGEAESRSLIWNLPNVLLTDSVALPDASRWSIIVQGSVYITQATDNKPCFIMSPTAYRYDIGLFEGGKVIFNWANNQPSTNTAAQCIGLNPQVAIPDGLFRVRVGIIQNDNGYDCIAFTPAAVLAGYNMPCWNWTIEGLIHETFATGRLWAPQANSSTGGAPSTTIKTIYIKGTNASVAPLNVIGQVQLGIQSLEIGNATKRMALFTSCVGLYIERLRVENCDLAANEDAITFAGSVTNTVGHFEAQVVRNTGASTSGVLRSSTNAKVAIIGGVEVRGCSVTGSGKLAALITQDGGKISLPANVKMQTTSNDVFLYRKEEGSSFSFTSSHIVGPYSFNNVSAASFSSAVAGYNGTATFTEISIPVDGFIVGILVRLSAAITAGTLSVYPRKNGVDVAGGALKADITSGQDGSAFGVFAWEPPTVNAEHSVSRGDRLAMRLNASGVTGGGNAVITVLIAERI